MRNKAIVGAVLVLAATAIAGCSSTTSSPSSAADQSASMLTTTPTSAAPVDAATTATAPPSTPAVTTTTTAAKAKPVSVLLAKIPGPVTTTNMPKANPAWFAALQKTMDDGTMIAAHRGVPANLMALVDEAAKTSDVDALIKLCNSCASPDQKTAFTQAMTQKDTRGRTGFAQLSFLLEHTHPGQTYTQAAGGEFPGFASPLHVLASTDPNYAKLTGIDQTDMKALGVSSIGGYKGIKVAFENLDDGLNPYDGWIGLAPEN